MEIRIQKKVLILKLRLQYRDDKNTHKTPAYFRATKIYVKNIDKNDDNTWRTIYEAIDEPYFGEVETFPKLFLYQF